MPKLRTILLILVVAPLVFLSHGCYPVTGKKAYLTLSRMDADLPVDRSKRVPMMRIGSLPHPFGPIPVNYANPNRLGEHRFRESALRSIRLAETSSGIIYTRQVGFIDLAHTRNSADLTWYAYRRIHDALLHSRPRVLLAGAEPTLFLLHLDYPEAWHALDADQRAALADPIAVTLAVRMGYVISTWHEVLTTFGFHGVPGIPEHQSAFMYDDQPSHRVGAVAAGEAIRLLQQEDMSFNKAMTAALADAMHRLGPLNTSGSRRAVRACKGQWWGLEGSSVRQVHLGMQGELFEPILIHERFPGVLGDADDIEALPGDAWPIHWEVPTLAQLADRMPELASAIPAERVTLDPNVSYTDEILQSAGLDAVWLDLDRDGPALKAYLMDRLTQAPSTDEGR